MASVKLPESLTSLEGMIEPTAVREGDLVDAYVPVELINTEDVPVDPEHVDELKEHFKKEREASSGRRTGQLTPIMLAHVEVEPLLPITDGFHRTAVIVDSKYPEAFSTIRPRATWETVMDLRIVSATSRREVRFARIVEWIDAAWRLSPWSTKINVTQAFTLASNPNLTGRKLDVSEDEKGEICEWVARKCQQWNLSPSTVLQSLQTARVIDPELLHQARESKGRGSQKGIISPQQLKVIGAALPNNYAYQRLVASHAMAEGLPAPVVKTIATLISGAKNYQEAKEMIDSGVWRSLASPSRPLGRPPLDREQYTIPKTSEQLINELRFEIRKEEIELARLSLENAILRGRYLPPELGAQPDFPPLKGAPAPERVLTERGTAQLRSHLESLRPAAVAQLSTKTDETTAQTVYDASVERLLEDVRQGALSYFELDKQTINKIFVGTMTIEMQKIDRPSNEARENAGRTSAVEENGDLTAFAIDQVLPDLAPWERRALILGSLYRLSSFAIAQVVNVQISAISALLETINEKVEEKKITPRAKGSLSRVNGHADVEASQEIGLSPTEAEVLALVAAGLTNEQIAKARVISQETVKSHLKHLFERTGTVNRTHLARFALENGLVTLGASLDD